MQGLGKVYELPFEDLNLWSSGGLHIETVPRMTENDFTYMMPAGTPQERTTKCCLN